MFRYYISNGREVFDIDGTKKDAPFPESLLRFLYLDILPYDQLLKDMSRALRDYYPSRDEKYLEVVVDGLDGLAGKHPYFAFLRYDWTQRMERVRQLKKGDDSVLDLLPHKELAEIYSDVSHEQKQIKALFAAALDKDSSQQSVAGYLATSAGDTLHTYRFRKLTVSYELMDRGELTDVLYPTTFYDILDFALRECIKREIEMRVCKNCGHYFALTGKGTAEYCDITQFENGRTCKDVGAMRLYTKNKKDNTIFGEYRREYKKRFAWIKSGRIESSAFYAWSALAKEKEAECEASRITFEEFKAWLARP